MFNVNSRFWQFLNKMADQLLLTLLYSLCCLPVVTIGAATASYFSVSMELHQDLEGAIFRDYWKRMKRDLKRGTVLWMAELFLTLLLLIDLRLCWAMKSQIGYFLLPILGVILLGVMMVGTYAFALMPHVEANWRALLGCAAHLAVTYLPYSVSMLVMVVLCVAMATMYGWAIILLPAVALYQFSRIFAWIFRRTPQVQQLLTPGDIWKIS